MALNYPKNMGTEWLKLKQDVKQAFTSANSRVPYQKIAAGILKVSTSLEILAGAYMKFIWSDGSTGAYMGRFTFVGAPSPSEGIVINDQDGNIAFQSAFRPADGYGFTAIRDRLLNAVVSDDAVAGKGLATPWVGLTFTNTTEISTPPSARQTSNTTDTALVSTYTQLQHPKMQMTFYVYIQTSPATATVKVKDLTSGETLYTSSALSGGYQNVTFSLGTWNYLDTHQLDVTVARASGTGNVGITVLSLMGRQS